MASGGDREASEEERIQGSLNEVLRYAIANTPSEPSQDSDLQREPLSEEKRDFLNKVFTDMLRDEVKEMKEHVSIVKGLLESETEEDQEKKEECLEALMDLCETIDNAQDFLKIGGADVALTLCNDPSSEVRWRALDLLATTVQNNAFNQNVMLERGALKLFLGLLDGDASYQVRVKALYAVSCLVRENDAAQDGLVAEDGFSSLMRAMQGDVEKLQIKAAFLLSALLWEQPKFNDILHNMGMVQQLIHLLQGEHQMFHEHVMSAILNLVSRHAGCLGDSLHPELRFGRFLEERVRELTGHDEYLEELEYCQALIAFYSKQPQSESHQGADR